MTQMDADDAQMKTEEGGAFVRIGECSSYDLYDIICLTPLWPRCVSPALLLPLSFICVNPRNLRFKT